MKATFTHLEITRLAYNEANPRPNLLLEKTSAEQEYAMLKNMQNKVDSSLAMPSQNSVDAILAALKLM